MVLKKTIVSVDWNQKWNPLFRKYVMYLFKKKGEGLCFDIRFDITVHYFGQEISFAKLIFLVLCWLHHVVVYALSAFQRFIKCRHVFSSVMILRITDHWLEKKLICCRKNATTFFNIYIDEQLTILYNFYLTSDYDLIYFKKWVQFARNQFLSKKNRLNKTKWKMEILVGNVSKRTTRAKSRKQPKATIKWVFKRKPHNWWLASVNVH